MTRSANMRDLLQSTLGGGVSINTVFRPGLWHALADPTQIELVVLNLVINARDAMDDRGNVTIETANARIGPPEQAGRAAGRRLRHDCGDRHRLGHDQGGAGQGVRAIFHDQGDRQGLGPGIEPGAGLCQAVRRRHADRNPRRRRHVGQGLSAARRGQCSRGRAGRGRSRPGDQSIAKAPSILLVDDDSAVREVTAAILEDLGYVVLKVGSGGAALDLLDRQSNIDLVLLDFAMPGMSGVEVARQVQSKYPAIPILFVTGYADKTRIRRRRRGPHHQEAICRRRARREGRRGAGQRRGTGARQGRGAARGPDDSRGAKPRRLPAGFGWLRTSGTLSMVEAERHRGEAWSTRLTGRSVPSDGRP